MLRGAQTVLAPAAERAAALTAWDERLREVRRAYERHLAGVYAAETRWPDEPLWSRRRETNKPTPPEARPQASRPKTALA